MKLSKNKLNKIKNKKNDTRKKFNNRRKKRSKHVSEKKHKKHRNMKNKTLKIYVGGAGNCNYKEAPTRNEFIKMKNDKRKDVMNKYFTAATNMDCLEDARKTIIDYLQGYYKSKKNADETMLLRNIWEKSLTDLGLDSSTLGKYNISVPDIMPDKKMPPRTAQQDEDVKAKYNENAKKNKELISQACKGLPKLGSTIDKDIPILSKDISQSITMKWDSLKINKINDIDYREYDIIGDGDCLYEAIIAGILINKYGKYNEIPGWKPQKIVKGNSLPKYIGNFKNVLATYICANITKDDTKFIETFGGVSKIYNTFNRIIKNEWGEENEAAIIAKLFNVCIAINTPDTTGINQGLQFIDKSGILLDNEPDNSDCGKNVIYIINKGQKHFDLLLQPELSPKKDDAKAQQPDPDTDPAMGLGSTSSKSSKCDISSLDDTVPENEDDANDKYDKIQDLFKTCEDDEATMFKLLEIWSTYVDNFKVKFNKDPKHYHIDKECMDLFKGEDMDYNFVPNDLKQAEEKLDRFYDLMVKNIGEKCESSIANAIDIYQEKFDEMHPNNKFKSNNVPTGQEQPTGQAESKQEEPTGQAESKQEEPTGQAESKQEDASNESKPLTNDEISAIFNTLSKGADEISQVKFIVFLTKKDDQNALLIRKKIGFTEPFTRNDITKGKDTNDVEALKKLSVNSQIANSLFRTLTQFELPKDTQSGGADTDEGKSGSEGITKKKFLQFVNCGQYRDKTENLFDCKNVKFPSPSAPPGSAPESAPGTESGKAPESAPGTESGKAPGTESGKAPGTESGKAPGTESGKAPEAESGKAPGTESGKAPEAATGIPVAEPVSNEDPNINVQINETSFNDTIKRVDLSIFIPKDGTVIVKNYAKNNAKETLNNLSGLGV